MASIKPNYIDAVIDQVTDRTFIYCHYCYMAHDTYLINPDRVIYSPRTKQVSIICPECGQMSTTNLSDETQGKIRLQDKG